VPRIVFPGNLQGRHANETGPKGFELVTVEAGRIDAEFVPLELVRWSQLTVDLDAVDHLTELGQAFRDALQPLLVGSADRLHAVRVTLNGSTGLYGVEAHRPGTLDAAIRAAAQDIAEAEIWIEQVRLDLSAPLDRAQAAQREDAVGELVRLVDGIGADDAALRALAEAELGDLFKALPPEVMAGEVPNPDDSDELRDLLRDAEATVLARLAIAEGGR